MARFRVLRRHDDRRQFLNLGIGGGIWRYACASNEPFGGLT